MHYLIKPIQTMNQTKNPSTPLGRIKLFFTFFDARWEDMTKETWLKNVYKDPSLFLLWFALSVIFVFLIEYLVNL